jgi:hypothetical protein
MAAKVVKLNCDAGRSHQHRHTKLQSQQPTLADQHRLNVHVGGQLMLGRWSQVAAAFHCMLWQPAGARGSRVIAIAKAVARAAALFIARMQGLSVRVQSTEARVNAPQASGRRAVPTCCESTPRDRTRGSLSRAPDPAVAQASSGPTNTGGVNAAQVCLDGATGQGVPISAVRCCRLAVHRCPWGRYRCRTLLTPRSVEASKDWTSHPHRCCASNR